MTKIVAGNWKLHKGPKETKEFAFQLRELAKNHKVTMVIFPQALSLPAAIEAFKSSSIQIGGQNAYADTSGAFTGENSMEVLKELGATHVLIGHSERRKIFGETDELLAKKMRKALELRLTPILCVGETLEERKAARTESVLATQLDEGLKSIEKNAPFWLAYEPVWAIGTGQVATPEQAKEAHAFIRQHLGSQCQAPILYGGSVKPDNAKQLGEQPNIDGFLVGGASLEAQSFYGIAQKLETAT